MATSEKKKSTLTMGEDNFLTSPSSEDKPNVSTSRIETKFQSDTLFDLQSRSYKQQFGDMYFLRLAVLKPVVEEVALEEWGKIDVEGEKVRRVERVLEVRQGEICWVAGTVFMEMPLKPNVLEEIAKDHFISAPPSRDKYRDFENDQVMLEDESGRLRLIGAALENEMLCTGCIIAVMGSETASGDFEVIDIRFPDLPPQSPIPPATGKPRYVALASGLSLSGEMHESLETHLMAEYLSGELAGVQDQKRSASIARIILAGNSLAHAGAIPVTEDSVDKKSSKKYGYDSAAYNCKPTEDLDAIISDMCSSISVIMMPGDQDPANSSLPQQPMHAAMFPSSKAYLDSTLFMATNPYSCVLDGVKFLGTSGQTISDIYKYVDGEDRLKMMENTLRWRHVAPTAPDTLWCYPFQDQDQFVIDDCPHVYFAGNQPKFGTRVIHGPQGQIVRLITIPKFSETSEMILLDLDTLECEAVNFKAGVK